MAGSDNAEVAAVECRQFNNLETLRLGDDARIRSAERQVRVLFYQFGHTVQVG